jgi:large subunit ribosomal protein L17
MKHRKKKYNRSCLASNLECLRALLDRERGVVTTLRQAKAMKSLLESLITKAKGYHQKSGQQERLHCIRQIGRYVGNNSVVINKIINLGKRYKDRPGGYTRIIKLAVKNGRSSCVFQVV